MKFVFNCLLVLTCLKFTCLETNQVECADEVCSVPIGSGMAQTVITANLDGYIGMRKGEEGQIFGVVGKDLFLVETQAKKRGFVSQKLFREMRLKRKNLVKSNITVAKRRLVTSKEPGDLSGGQHMLTPLVTTEILEDSVFKDNIIDSINSITNSNEDSATSNPAEDFQEHVSNEDKSNEPERNETAKDISRENEVTLVEKKELPSIPIESKSDISNNGSETIGLDTPAHIESNENVSDDVLGEENSLIVDKNDAETSKDGEQQVKIEEKLGKVESGEKIADTILFGTNVIENIDTNFHQDILIGEDNHPNLSITSIVEPPSQKELISPVSEGEQTEFLNLEITSVLPLDTTAPETPLIQGEKSSVESVTETPEKVLMEKIPPSTINDNTQAIISHFSISDSTNDLSKAVEENTIEHDREENSNKLSGHEISSTDLNESSDTPETIDKILSTTLPQELLQPKDVSGLLDENKSSSANDSELPESTSQYANTPPISTNDYTTESSMAINSQISDFIERSSIESPDVAPEKPLGEVDQLWSRFSNDFASIILDKSVENFNFIIVLTIVIGALILHFNLSYCLKQCSREKNLIQKLNTVERNLLTLTKENANLKFQQETENSYYSNKPNDEYKISAEIQNEIDFLHSQIVEKDNSLIILEKELQSLKICNENMVERSILENSVLNKSVEDLSKKIYELQLTIDSLTASLEEKNLDLSKLQSELNESNSKATNLKHSFDDVELEKICLENELKTFKSQLNEKLNEITSSKEKEIERIQQKLNKKEKETIDLHQKYRMSEAKIQTLLNEFKQADKVDADIDTKASLLLSKRECDHLRDQLTQEIDAKELLKQQCDKLVEELASQKASVDILMKEKLEAKTRLDILTSYFKEKEAELQREINSKQVIWLRQQGETTNTVDRIRAIEDENQHLREQNGSLKTEILTQETTLKAQIAILENKIHEAWLTTRQYERKIEELKNETTLLRRRLTSLAQIQEPSFLDNSNHVEKMSSLPADLNIPSPIRVDSPKTPMLNVLHPLPYIPPPQFLPPLNGPTSFLPPPPPLGDFPRHLGRYAASPPATRDYSPNNHHRYSPDFRFRDDYSIITPYDTETDLSPQHSPVRKTKPFKRTGSNGNKS